MWVVPHLQLTGALSALVSSQGSSLSFFWLYCGIALDIGLIVSLEPSLGMPLAFTVLLGIDKNTHCSGQNLIRYLEETVLRSSMDKCLPD